jgi:type I restriction enzyme S subunit
LIRESPIGDIAEAIIDYRGRTPPKSAIGVRLLTAKVIKDGTIDESRLEYISEETYLWWMRRGFPRLNDILVTTEAPLGETAILRDRQRVALAQRVILLRGDPTVIDQNYFFAAMRSPLIQDRLRQRATGTTVLGSNNASYGKSWYRFHLFPFSARSQPSSPHTTT